MEGRYLLRIVLFSFFCVITGNANAQLAKRCKVKFREAGLKYSQLKDGYFQGYYSLWRETGLGYAPTLMENEFVFGYSPWHNAFTAEINHRHMFLIISFGGGVGYCTKTDFSQDLFYIKPEVGINLDVCQIYYTYSFTSDNVNLYHAESNLTLSVPLFSTTHFGSCEKTKRWKTLGVMFSIFKGERWQIWE